MLFLYPHINPVAFAIGGFSVRWYALAYITGFLLGRALAMRLCRVKTALYPEGKNIKPEMVDDFLSFAILGVLLGGRLGYVLFYNFSFFLEHPAHILQIWEGGMSFHGGMLGVVFAIALFSYWRQCSFLRLGDIVVAAVPIGLLLGRLANFINGELWGRPTGGDWGMVFPHVDELPRHPSQLYQAFLEGITLFTLLNLLAWRSRILQYPGRLAGIFLAGYATARTVGELFREPDAQIGFLAFGITMGQLLSVPMFITGAGLILYSFRKKTPPQQTMDTAAPTSVSTPPLVE
ncbi:MAG: prolipoprotein diacylglyceryl transferase [Alphaproteobacteria bacterium]